MVLAAPNVSVLRPTEDQIIVRPEKDEGEQVTSGGIIIPEQAKEKSQEGEVIAAGLGRYEFGAKIPMEVKAGDRVLFSKYGGTEVKVDDETLLVLRSRDVLAVLDPK